MVSFCSSYKYGSVVSEQSTPCFFFQYMSPMRSRYRELGIKLVSLEEILSCTHKKLSMVGEKKDDQIRDPFKMLLEEALERQRNEMMDNFAQIVMLVQLYA
jgi:hypothetical protein